MYCEAFKVEEIDDKGVSKLVPLYRNRADLMQVLKCSPRHFSRLINGEKSRKWLGLIYLCPELRFEPSQEWFSPDQQAAVYYYAICIRKKAVKPLQTLINEEGFPYDHARELFKHYSDH